MSFPFSFQGSFVVHHSNARLVVCDKVVVPFHPLRRTAFERACWMCSSRRFAERIALDVDTTWPTKRAKSLVCTGGPTSAPSVGVDNLRSRRAVC